MTQTTDRPAEHCGHQPDHVIGQPTECVLRPGHSGSHADHRGMRWWMANLGDTPISQDQAPADRPGINQLTSDQLDQLYARLEKAELDAEQQERNYRVLMNERTSYREGWKYEQKRRAVAEARLAQLHEGEEPYTDDRIVPTPDQWIWQWNRATPAKRMEVATALIDASERADRCFIENHKNALPALRQRVLAAETTIERARTEEQKWREHFIARGDAPAAHALAMVRGVLDQHGQTAPAEGSP
ncbi:hypothetical protein ACFTWD_09400 [Streptomyces sp. NPDC056943]|uniref:hypothetical protein n=1 Tax=Streptomyces sp. NPDC056943 TaxID=3345971 RepID=UPI00363057B3